jgi:hypothetical protein
MKRAKTSPIFRPAKLRSSGTILSVPEESVFYCSGGSSTAKAAEADITPEFHTLG